MGYASWELDFLQALQNIHNPILNNIMVFITRLGDKGFIWFLIAIVMISIKKYRKCGIVVALSLLFSIISCDIIMKNFIARMRPSFLFDNYEQLIPAPLSYSFPSGHTQNSFSAAFSIYFLHQKEGIAALILASAIAFSRMYLFVHWPTDIVGGLVFGFICAAVSCLAVNSLYQTLRKRSVHRK